MVSDNPSLKLYSFASGLFPPRVLLYIQEKGIPASDIDIIDVPFEAGHIKWDLAITDNPAEAASLIKCLKSVPILRLTKPDGTNAFLYESTSIVMYLEDHYNRYRPDLPALDGGSDLIARAVVAETVCKINEITTLFQMYGHHASSLFAAKIEVQDVNVARVCLDQIRSQMRLLEARVDGQGPFLCGEQATVADCMAYATFQLAINFYGMSGFLDDFQILGEWYQMFKHRQSVKAVMPEYPEFILDIARKLSVE